MNKDSSDIIYDLIIGISCFLCGYAAVSILIYLLTGN